MRNRIAGHLDMAALAALTANPDPATLHKPTDPDTLRREAHRLTAEGLLPADIAACLGLSRPAVLQLLQPEETHL